MADREIIDKLTGVVLSGKVRIDGLQGEGAEKVVLRATHLDDGKQLVVKLYQSNPMFLLNELDFEFRPRTESPRARADRYVTILEKLVLACERDNPGLFFWHLESLYTRLLFGLCSDFAEYGAAVMDTTTSLFQNSELIAVATKVQNRKRQLDLLHLDYWEMYVKEEVLRDVHQFLSMHSFGKTLNFRRPTQLLALVFCEGFFGDIPTEHVGKSTGGVFGDLTSDSPAPVEAEDVLLEFLKSADFGGVVSTASEDLDVLRQALGQLRTMLLEDALDKAEQLKQQGDNFLMRYNAGRNTLLRGLPRFLRALKRGLGTH